MMSLSIPFLFFPLIFYLYIMQNLNKWPYQYHAHTQNIFNRWKCWRFDWAGVSFFLLSKSEFNSLQNVQAMLLYSNAFSTRRSVKAPRVSSWRSRRHLIPCILVADNHYPLNSEGKGVLEESIMIADHTSQPTSS